MKQCSACGGEIQENMRFCPHCGAGVQELDDQPLKDYWAEKLARQPEQEEDFGEKLQEDWTKEVADEDLLDLDEEEAEIKKLMDGVKPVPKKRNPWILMLVLFPAFAVLLLNFWMNHQKKVTSVPGAGLYLGCSAEGKETSYRNAEDWVELHPNGTMDLKLTGTQMEGHWKLEGETFLGHMDHRDLEGTLKEGILSFPYGKVKFIFALPESREEILKNQNAAETTGTVPAENPYMAWAGDYYGTMIITGGTGNWEGNSGETYDVCGRILLEEDQTGRLFLWNRENQPGDRFLLAVVEFLEGTTDFGKMTVRWGRLHDMELGPGAFAADPGKSPYSYYENLFCIRGQYVSMDEPGDAYTYEIVLRPWGESWVDVAGSEEDFFLLPPSYYEWYLPLQNAGKKMPDSF